MVTSGVEPFLVSVNLTASCSCKLFKINAYRPSRKLVHLKKSPTNDICEIAGRAANKRAQSELPHLYHYYQLFSITKTFNCKEIG